MKTSRGFSSIETAICVLIGSLFIAGAILLTGGRSDDRPVAGLTSGSPALQTGVATSSVFTVGTDTLVLATSTGREWARISTFAVPITCNYALNSGVQTGFVIAASSTHEMNGQTGNVFTGQIKCTSGTGASARVYVQSNE